MSADAVYLSDSNAAPGSEFSSVNVPSKIFTNGGLQLDATGIVSFDSFAKVIRPPSGSIDHQEVLFSFPYANTTSLDQVISVNGVVGLNGVVGAGDDGGWTVFGHDHNTLQINAIMRMFADTTTTRASACSSTAGRCSASTPTRTAGRRVSAPSSPRPSCGGPLSELPTYW
ncbi:MAG TPA: hypothetical protein VIA11_22410 [Acidimicrobiia bacterium]|nr:hypothetical protein [Acidimicrobiia bacterium]